MYMITNYENYLKENKIIKIEECMQLHNMMVEEIGNDQDAIELYDEIIEKAIEYVSLRVRWTFMDIQWKMDEDPGRTRKHDALIVKFNQLAKYLKMQGKDAKWRDLLGYTEDDPELRQRIGDFACFMVYIHGINGR